MEQFSFGNFRISSLDRLEKLIKEGLSYGLDLKDLLSKVDRMKSMMKDGVVRIVLLGSFSDGKTSAIAGLLGRLDAFMKIDQDESSDEITVYHPDGLKKGFELVDTPGLFGTKEKELDGKNVKFSDITKRYVSEAHIIIYVCDAVAPLKESHVPIIKWIMRDLKKLDSTIFVINKMDEAGYDLMDDEEFANGTHIKKQNLISRLRSTINLTPSEESRLHIVCIAADPKGKGLEHWFAKADNYMKRSHIGLLRDELNTVVANSDVASLQSSTASASVKDVLSTISREIDNIEKPTTKALEKVTESCKDLQVDLGQLKSELDLNLNDMQKQLDEYRAGLKADIEGASVQTISDVVERAIGIEDGKLSFYVFQRNVDSIIHGAMEVSQNAIRATSVKFERKFDDQDKFMNAALKEGSKFLGKTSISNTQVLAVRDMLFKSFKFKPWGATKLAGNITKGLGWAAIGINVVLEFYSWWKDYKAAKELGKIKKELLSALDKIFKDIYLSFNGDSYYDNFTPAYKEMCKALENREQEVVIMQGKVDELGQYKSKITSYMKENAQNVEFSNV